MAHSVEGGLKMRYFVLSISGLGLKLDEAEMVLKLDCSRQ